MRGALSVASTADLREADDGSNRYFTEERVRGALSTVTSDVLVEGGVNLFCTRPNVVGLQIDVSEFADRSGMLLTDESFLGKLHLVSNDLVSADSVRTAMQSLSTDDLPEGASGRYLTGESLASVLSREHVAGTGLLSSDVAEGPGALFFTEDRVHGVLRQTGEMSLQVETPEPGEVRVAVSVSGNQELGGTVEIDALGAVHSEELPPDGAVARVFSRLRPGAGVVTAVFRSRHVVLTQQAQVLVAGQRPVVTGVDFPAAGGGDGFTDRMLISLGGHGTAELSVTTGDLVIHRSDVDLYSTSSVEVALGVAFRSALVRLTQGAHVADHLVEMHKGLVLPLKSRLRVLGAEFDPASPRPFAGVRLEAQTALGAFDANAFHSPGTPRGCVVSAEAGAVTLGLRPPGTIRVVLDQGGYVAVS